MGRVFCYLYVHVLLACVCGEGRGQQMCLKLCPLVWLILNAKLKARKLTAQFVFQISSLIYLKCFGNLQVHPVPHGKDEPLLSQALQVLASYLQTRATQVASFPGIPHFLCSLACIGNNKWKGGEKLETRLLQKNKKRDQAESISAAISLFCSTLHVCVILLMSHGSKLACSSSSRDEM